MILLFPDLDTVRLALTGGIVPADVSLAPAAVTFDDQGKVYVEPTVNLTRAVTKNLDRLGVKGSKRHATDDPREVTCWPQLLPVARDPAAPVISNQQPVLFELEDAADLPVLVIEMLRLGNDRQGFRWFASPDDADARRVLLRVIGPPYYTLLRALDKGASGTAGAVRAYLERAPRVWVEVGHTLPLAGQLRVADKQLVLIRAPREWLYLDEAPFQDVYDNMQFQLPAAPVGWSEAKAPKRMQVPLKLAPGNASETAELWVLRENAVEQLDTLVRDSDDRLLQRLMFAVATDASGARTVILRVRPSKLTPPVLTLDNALAFKPFWKLPNLFLPVGRRLHPTLRRDAVRKLLADDADQVVWLYPGENGTFTPEFVPDAAFRSLEDWVDYVIEAEQQALAAWVEATRFDFDTFVCKEVGGPKVKPDKGDKDKDEKDDVKGPKSAGPAPKAPAKGKPAAAKPAASAEFLPPVEEVKKPNEWKVKAKELETQFLALEGPLDSPERKELWPELAAAYTGAKEPMDAAICWLDALWDSDPLPPAWLAGWVRSELPDAGSTIKADEFDKLLHHQGTGLGESRAVVAAFLWLSAQTPVPQWLMSRLPAIQAYLESHDSSLPVRAVWLAGFRLAQLSGADVLGLARVRDRLLKRLLEQGLQPERDLPYFLRVAGVKDSERMRVVRDKAMELHSTIRKWLDDCGAVQKNEHMKANHPLVDMLFAFAVGKLGEATQAKKLLDDARKVLERPVPSSWQDNKLFEQVVSAVTSNFVYKAYKYRVEQVLAGKPPTGPLSPEIAAELEELAGKARSGGTNNPFLRGEYVIGRLREQSRILEPQERLDPYSYWTKNQDPLKKELAELHGVKDPGKFADRVRKLYKEGVTGKTLKEVQFHVLHEGLPLASLRAPEAFTVELLNLVPSALQGFGGGPNESPDLPKKQGELLERALFLAGHYNRDDLVKKLVDDFTALVHAKPLEMKFKLINVVANECMRNLRRLGLSNEIDRFLTKLHSEVLGGATPAELKKKHQAKPEVWAAVLQTQLNLAGGWLHFGRQDRANPILEEARNELIGSGAVALQPKDYTELARAYVTALGQGPAEPALVRMIELFKKMSPAKITNTWTTAQYYSRFHLNLVEDVIRAVVNDDAALGPSGRRWLDDDEFLVRRRIHADMKKNLEKNHL